MAVVSINNRPKRIGKEYGLPEAILSYPSMIVANKVPVQTINLKPNMNLFYMDMEISYDFTSYRIQTSKENIEEDGGR